MSRLHLNSVTMTEHRKKSRHQSKLEFIESLIREYFIADMRSKCYPSRIDRRFHLKVANGKKERIIDICTDIGVPCIFDDKSLYDNYERAYYPLNEVPRVIENKQDELAYYCKNSDVLIRAEEKHGAGKIISYNTENKTVIATLFPTKEEVIVKSHLVSRVF